MYEERMLNYYPQVIQSIVEYRAIINSEYPEFELASEGKDRVTNDAYLLTMTEERIIQWEKILKIKPSPGETLENRRDTIIARIRGRGKLNTESINSIVNAFSGGTADSWVENSCLYVVVSPPPGTKKFKLDNIDTEIRRRKPAHLDFNISRNYYTWNDIRNNIETWGDVKTELGTWEEVYLFVPFQ